VDAIEYVKLGMNDIKYRWWRGVRESSRKRKRKRVRDYVQVGECVSKGGRRRKRKREAEEEEEEEEEERRGE
jgi:hypothetical protein